MHDEAKGGACTTIEGNGLLLIDSGGQYLGGTTDITRMVAVGEICAEEKRDCTLVLSTSEFGEFLQFETLTLCTIAPRCWTWRC